jgi:hypothetical protein
VAGSILLRGGEEDGGREAHGGCRVCRDMYGLDPTLTPSRNGMEMGLYLIPISGLFFL